MNKHLNNWLDKQEGLPKETTNNNIIREMARQGGLASAKKRLGDKTQSEISEIMKRVRRGSKKQATSSQDLVDCLNLSIHLKQHD
jgi:hypothetical protein